MTTTSDDVLSLSLSTGEKIKHPAPYSPEILKVMARWIRTESFTTGKRQRRMRVLDPFAGTGRVHQLPGLTFGIELEPEWAEMHPRTQVGTALELPWRSNSFDVVATSPCYGNRFADSHNAQDGSRRRGYKHDLGRMPTEGSSAVMQWGRPYKDFHLDAWEEVVRVLRPGGLFILNISDHIRGGKRQFVSAWHCGVIEEMGLEAVCRQDVPTRRMRQGQNHAARVECEHVFAFRMPN